MKTMSKSRLKTHMLEVFREIQASGEPLYVTDQGTPVLKIEALEPTHFLFDVFAPFQGRVAIPDDALSPEPEEWEGYL